MAKSEFNRRLVTNLEISFGPFHWQSTSLHEFAELDSDDSNSQRASVERLQNLINQALEQNCTAQELKTLLSRHSSGDHHVDA